MFDYNKEIKGCANCPNSQYLEIVDCYIPRDENVCIEEKCEHYTINNKKFVDDLIRADVSG